MGVTRFCNGCLCLYFLGFGLRGLVESVVRGKHCWVSVSLGTVRIRAAAKKLAFAFIAIATWGHLVIIFIIIGVLARRVLTLRIFIAILFLRVASVVFVGRFRRLWFTSISRSSFTFDVVLEFLPGVHFDVARLVRCNNVLITFDLKASSTAVAKRLE